MAVDVSTLNQFYINNVMDVSENGVSVRHQSFNYSDALPY